MLRFTPPGLGWHRDLPDMRDCFLAHERVRPMLAPLGSWRTPSGAVSWQEYFPPADCQLGLASGAARAANAWVAYFERRAFGKSVEGSQLFLYQMARLLQHGSGDCGGSSGKPAGNWSGSGCRRKSTGRTRQSRWRSPPGPFLFSLAAEYRSLLYMRLARGLGKPALTLRCVKSFIAAGFPVAFGFTVFASLSREALIPFPTCYDAVRSGQVAVALG